MAGAAALAQPTKTVPPTPVPKEQARARMMARTTSLQKALSAQEPVLRDLQEHLAPYRGRFQVTQQGQRGQRKGRKIIDNTAGRAFSILSSGLMAGLTSPARPWFRLGTADPDLSEFTPHRQWLDDAGRSMRALLARSNFYNVMPSVYGELGPFGTAALLEVEDPQSVARFYSFTIGSYAVAQDDRLVVDTFVREYTATVRQLVSKFGTERLSQTTLNNWKQGKLEVEVPCVHLIRPNDELNPRGFGWVSMPFVEEYWEKTGDKQEPLLRSGYRERALFVPRWDVTNDDVWGTGLGHSIIGDVRQLQFLQRRKEDVLDKHVAPPLEAGAELRGQRISLLSGDVTYTNPSQTGGAQVRPILTTDPNAYRYAVEDIADLRNRIRASCYEDLFLMLSNDTRSGITAREVEERHQEKMLVLGPVLERMNEELFDPVIDRTYAIMERQSRPIWEGKLEGQPLLPPPPKGLEAHELRVEYVSILAQAAKATNTRGLEAFGMFVGSLAQMAPETLDKVDFDQMVDEYADAQGVPARVVRGDDDVAAMRQSRAQNAKMQQMAQLAGPMKDAASALQTAATTVPEDGSVLANMANTASGGALPGLPAAP